jgi:hypothetical protein
VLNVEKWAIGKPPLIAISAIQLVTFSDFLYEIIPQAKERRLFGHQFSLPDLPVWFDLYKSPRKPIIAFGKMISEFSEQGKSLIFLFFGIRKLRILLKRNPNYFRDNPPSPEDIREGQKFYKNLCDQVFSDIKDDLDPLPVDPEEKTRFLKYLEDHEQELGFFFFLFIPSLLIFQTSPFVLYRKAVAGDIDAIEKLLKLDPVLLHEPAIGQHIQQLRLSNKTNDYERLTAAAHKLAVTDHTEIDDARKRSKVELAAIISALSQLTGKRLTSTKIADLFHKYAKDKKQEGVGDLDIPAGESFNKAIKRHIQPWNDLLQKPDNKI